MFDEGPLRQDPEKARQMVESLFSIMRNDEALSSKTPLVEVYDTVWHRLRMVCESMIFGRSLTADFLSIHLQSVSAV